MHHDCRIATSFGTDVDEKVDILCREFGCSRSSIARAALLEYLEKRRSLFPQESVEEDSEV